MLKELRTQSFRPWIEKMWDTPKVSLDNLIDQRLHDSISLRFADNAARDTVLTSSTVEKLSRQLMPLASAIPAYDVDAELTYLRRGPAAPRYEE